MKKPKTRAQLAAELMAGNTDNWTQEDAARLYPNMPTVAAAVWNNIQTARTATGARFPQMPRQSLHCRQWTCIQ